MKELLVEVSMGLKKPTAGSSIPWLEGVHGAGLQRESCGPGDERGCQKSSGFHGRKPGPG